MQRQTALFIALLGLVLAVFASGQEKPASNASTALPGQRSDGSVLLPNQWSLRPVGRQAVLGDFPVNIAVHPASRFAAILHSGYSTHEIVVVEIQPGPAAGNSGRRPVTRAASPAGSSASPTAPPRPPEVVSRVTVPESFYGVEFSRDGSTLYCSGAGDEVIHAFAFKDGYLSSRRPIPLRDPTRRGIPAGIALNSQSTRLWVANVFGHSVTELNVQTGASTEILLASGASNPEQPLSASRSKLMSNSESGGIQTGASASRPQDPDIAAAAKRGEALLVDTRPDDPYPYACRLDEKRNRLYVSLWGQSAVAVVDLKSRQTVDRWPTQEHPNEMLLSREGKHLYVANANRNTVTVIDTESGKPLETISASLYPVPLPGSNPNSLALSPDEKTLFVANANNNNVAVFDVSVPGRSNSMGYIPVGWYPTSVRVTPDGKHLLIANGKGLISKANWNGPQPGKDPPASVREYIGSLFRGTLSVIDLPERGVFEKQLVAYTAQAFRCSPLDPKSRPPERSPDNPVPARLGDLSPIKHCIYVIKENRTYDQVLGDMPAGNGDPSLCLFGEKVTPNHHKLAREFVLLDNFYVDSEVSADGHEWSMGAYATDFVEKFWPLSYGHNRSGKYFYPSEGRFKIAEPSEGYLWDRAREAGISYRSYGEFIDAGKTADEPGKSRVASLQGHFDPWYRPWDMDYPDVKRAQRFIHELKRFEAEGDMPRLQIVRLGNDHTFGTSPDKPSPTAMVADNDAALGMLVEGVSRSKFWAQTAIFVVEDDAQNGSDHVDAHRSIAYVISPYVRRGSVDSTMYSTTSMLHTIELILGLRPMSQFDTAAVPMFNSFQSQANLQPYKALPANVDLHEKNKKTAWGARLSAKMDFSKEDAADDLLLNEVIWRSIRGANSPMPPPTRAAFVFVHAERQEAVKEK
ncbi:MAG TPA: alkaline phosphatase family protein [Acidobacteriota bacterium]|jgi:YVTN family beta-propeller protein